MERTREEGGVTEWVQVRNPQPVEELPGQQYTFMGRSTQRGIFCKVIVGLEPAKKAPGGIWLPEEELLLYHLSISAPMRYPTWDEIADARYRFIPDDVTMAMLLPPPERYLNMNEWVLHLWQIDDRRNDYTSGAEYARLVSNDQTVPGQITLQEAIDGTE